MKCDRPPRFAAAPTLFLVLVAFAAAQHITQFQSRPAQTRQTSSRPGSAAHEHEPALTTKPAKFSHPATYSTGGYYAFSVAVADLSGDGKPDIVVANSCQAGDGGSNCSGGGVVSVLLGKGDGSLQSSVSYSSGGIAAISVAIADVNGDGFPDLLVANECMSATDCTYGSVGVLLGKGDGTFAPVVSYAAGNGTDSVAVGDFNKDGHVDLAAANQCLSPTSCNNGGVSILLGNGDGTFQAASTYNSGGKNSVFVAVKDLDGDGLPDVAVANQCVSKSNCTTGGVSVLLGNGNGTLRSATSYSSGGYSALSLALADVNGDGQPDIVATSLCATAGNCVDGVVAVLTNKGSGTFRSPATYSSNSYGASSVAIGDVNGDGKLDVVVDNICKTSVNCAKGGVALLLGNGDGTFQSPVLYSSGGNHATSVALADLNRDGTPDVVTTNSCATKSDCNGSVAVLLNNSLIKTTTVLSSSPNPSAVGQSVTFTATVTSTSPVPDGEVVTFYQGGVAIGAGTTSNGVASFTTSFSTAGSYIIKATYPGDSLHESSSGKVKQIVNG